MPGNNPADPWSWDAFNPPTPKPEGDGTPRPLGPPKLPKTPRLIPDVDELFSIQKDLVKAINFLAEAEQECHKAHGFLQGQRQAQNAYRLLNRWLRTYANPSTL